MPILQDTKDVTIAALNDDTGDLAAQAGLFDFSLDFGTLVATVTLERSFDGGSSFRTIDTFTSSVEQTLQVGSPQLVRARISAFTSGSGTARLRQRPVR